MHDRINNYILILDMANVLRFCGSILILETENANVSVSPKDDTPLPCHVQQGAAR